MLKNYSKKIKIQYYSAVKEKKIDWLWYPYIPYGKITIVQGDPGDGKTTLVLNIAALISKGLSMPFSEDKTPKGAVLYQSAEDGVSDTIKPRLIKAGADCCKIAFIDAVSNDLSLDNPYLEKAINKTKAKLLVLDPLQAYLGNNKDSHRANDMRPLMNSIAKVAERTGCAVIIVGHMNKSSGTKNLYRGLGSIDITASARSVLLVGRLTEEPDTRVLAHIKSNLAPEGKSIAFKINSGSSIKWLNKSVNREDIMECGGSKRDIAVEIILKMLKTGSKPPSEIYTACLGEHVQSRTVNTAKKILGVRSVKKPDGWHWILEK